MYELLFSPAAEKYLGKLKDKKLKATYREALERISADPLWSLSRTSSEAKVFPKDSEFQSLIHLPYLPSG